MKIKHYGTHNRLVIKQAFKGTLHLNPNAHSMVIRHNSSLEGAFYPTLPRKQWEKENWAFGWLCHGKKVEKAHCTVCDKDLVAGKSELISHTKTSSHIRLAKQIQSNR